MPVISAVLAREEEEEEEEEEKGIEGVEEQAGMKHLQTVAADGGRAQPSQR